MDTICTYERGSLDMEKMSCDYESWLNISKMILFDKVDKGKINCPCCEQRSIDFQCFGRETTMMGFMLVWCSECRKGINISRLKVPEDVSMLSMDISDEEYAKRIPKFELVESA